MKSIIILSLLFILSSIVYGDDNNTIYPEIIKTNSVVEKRPNEKVWFVNIGGFFRIGSGNVKEIKSNGNAYVQYNNNIFDFKVNFDFIYNNVYIPELSENYVSEDKRITKITADYYILSRLELFSFATNEYDRRKDHLYRNDFAVGAKFVAFRNMYWLLDFSYAPTFQNEKYSNESHTYEARHSLRARTELYFFEKRIKSSCIFYYVPLYNFTEYRIVLSAYIEIILARLKVTEDSNFSFKFEYKREQNPYSPEGVKNIDNLYIMSLQLYL
jgi:hypothetical protein